MLLVNALAGVGKSSTSGWGMGKRVPNSISLSDEQKAIIRHMRSRNGKRLAAQAFDRAATANLKKIMPTGVEVATSNAFGHRAWLVHTGLGYLKPDPLKTRKMFRDLVGERYSLDERRRIEANVATLVNLSKCYLFDPCTKMAQNSILLPGVEGYEKTRVNGVEALRWLGQRFDVETDGGTIEWSQKTFEASTRVENLIDYDDQIFLPIWYNVPLPEFDHLVADEVQDLNVAKQVLAFRMAKDITAVGDVHQAIYAFAGADSEAMANIWESMQSLDENAAQLPMTITRRCPMSHVRLANRFVPELRAAPDAEEGNIAHVQEKEFVKDLRTSERGRMILCRTNAPLLSLAFKLIANGRRCYVQGRDIGSGLKSEIRKTGSSDLRFALAKVHDRIDARIRSISYQELPDTGLIEALTDRRECIKVIANGCDSMTEYMQRVDDLFKDFGQPNDIILSSVHKAKGSEHRDVCIYKPRKLGCVDKTKGVQAKQELNLAYVAHTRSMDRLTFVKEPDEAFYD